MKYIYNLSFSLSHTHNPSSKAHEKAPTLHGAGFIPFWWFNSTTAHQTGSKAGREWFCRQHKTNNSQLQEGKTLTSSVAAPISITKSVEKHHKNYKTMKLAMVGYSCIKNPRFCISLFHIKVSNNNIMYFYLSYFASVVFQYSYPLLTPS